MKQGEGVPQPGTHGRGHGRGHGHGHERGRRRTRFGDQGQTAVDYIGTLVVVIAAVGALVATGIGQQIAAEIAAAICRAVGGNCTASTPEGTRPKTDADFEPKLCNLSTDTDTSGGKAKIGWFEWGEEYGFQEKVFQAKTDVNEDGKVDGDDKMVYLTFTDAASAGVTGSTPGVKLGKLGKADVDLGAGIKVTNGDTWVFKSEAEAKAVREDLEELKMWEQSNRHSNARGGGLGNSLLYLFGKGPMAKEEELRDRIEKRLGDDRQISQASADVNVSADGGLKISAGDDKKLSAALGGNVKISPGVTVTTDNFRKTKSYTYTAKLDYGTEATYEAGPVKGGSGAQDARTGAMTVTRDLETGELLRIDLAQTVEKGRTSDKADIGGDNGKKDDDKRGGKGKVKGGDSDVTIEIETNSVVFDKDPEPGDQEQVAKDRATAEAWLDGSGDNTAPFTYMFTDHDLTKAAGNDSAFDRMMFQRGMSSRIAYDGTINAEEYGFEISLGASLGFSISNEKKSESLSEAQFLGAPRADGSRAYVPYSYCAA
ncbi:hypothetical protein [Streptomyces sp. SYSU K217416]